ncbi:MAG: Protein-glutamine gamma-glutamyltransferase [Elusimicrobia bacterium ADurb.Bin231]|nr:MAG: Protein-glutamine gamma-glutamyltransferase [Elusimicrobia bacterium ADurb.Bin231]
MIKITRLGKGFCVAAFFSLFGAATSGNNILYIIFSIIISLIVIAFFVGIRNINKLKFSYAFPEQVFKNTPFKLKLLFSIKDIFPAAQITVSTPQDTVSISCICRRNSKWTEIKCVSKNRGLNELKDVVIASCFPFGIFEVRRTLDGIVGTAFPEIFEIYGTGSSLAFKGESRQQTKRGAGDEFFSIREYIPGEDIRLINWKLTAKTGIPLVKEYAQSVNSRVIITVTFAENGESERKINEAASLSKFFIDSGIEVKLITDEGDIDFGKGLLHLDSILHKLASLGSGKKITASFHSVSKNAEVADKYSTKHLLWISRLAALIVYASLFLLEDLSRSFIYIFGVVLLFGIFFDYKNIRIFNKLFSEIISGLFLLFIIFIDFPSTGILLATTHLVLFIFFMLILNYKSESSYKQLLLINFMIFFLVSGQTINLWYFPVLVFFVAVIFCWLFQWKDESELAPATVWTGITAFLFFITVCISIAVFIIMPRRDNPRMQAVMSAAGFNRMRRLSNSFSGLTENVRLGYYGSIRKNAGRAMRVTVFDGNGNPYKPSGEIRVRGSAFNYFAEGEWSKTPIDFEYDFEGSKKRALNSRGWIKAEKKHYFIFPGLDSLAQLSATEFYVYPVASALLFTTGNIYAAAASVEALSFDFTDTVYFPAPNISGAKYKIYSGSRYASFNKNIPVYESAVESYYLNMPEKNEFYLRIAEQYSSGKKLPVEKAKAIENYFRDNYFYSLSENFGSQTLHEFLSDTQTGNCEYFATAMCVLLRALGIPSRLVAGFVSDGWNEYGKFYDVRQNDAHAWVEAYFSGYGWMTFDPTPYRSEFDKKKTIVLKSIGKFLNAMQIKWYRHIIGYDNYTRKNYFYGFSLLPSKKLLLKIVGWTILVAAFALVLLLINRIKWRRIFSKPSKESGFYREVLSKLEKKGFKKEPWQTPKEFAEKVISENPEFASLSLLTEYFYRIKYAGERLNEAETDSVNQALETITRKLLKNQA